MDGYFNATNKQVSICILTKTSNVMICSRPCSTRTLSHTDF